MRRVRDIGDEENFRIVQKNLGPDQTGGFDRTVGVVRRDSIEPEPVGTIIGMLFRIDGYDKDCDGSLMARLTCIGMDGHETGYTLNCMGLYPESEFVTTPEEITKLVDSRS